ncbi:hypothetical protein Zmor_018329 [Zophobas morio]|uniref:Uncharacterized protein n=1 Tax=Zophobas morio TaxID=2755281 RepID=A0AA38MCX1_9CUCU|nr:hypothetical protein Zmor_018329 [Zophobas morio]
MNLACHNEDILENIEQPQPIQSYRERNVYEYNYIETTTESPIFITRVKSRTIICTNIYSTESIKYPFEEQNFEQHLKIQFSNISLINQCAFTTFVTITKLFLTKLNIKTILPGAFNGLTRLKELHLSDNNLEEISKGVFNSLHRLEILTLNNNKIHYIEDMAFTGADNLMILHLQNNKVETFDKKLLKTQKHLSYLDLSQNPLTKVSLESVSSLDTLIISRSLLEEFDDNLLHLAIKTLNLSSNQLRKIDFSLFPSVDVIDLSDNKIKIVDSCENLTSIRVDLSHNEIEIINGTIGDVTHFTMSHNKLEILQNFLFNPSETVISIDFSFNEISTIENYAFLGLTSLNNLNLQYNNVSKIDTVLFKDLGNLRYLNLSHNNLQKFRYGTFDSLLNLEALDISGNKLRDLHQFTFNTLANLRTLYFSDNHISTFDAKNLKTHLARLNFVSLDKNPWKCEELVNIKQAFKTMNIVIKEGRDYEVENFHGIACQNEGEFTNSLKNYQTDENGKHSKLEQFFNEGFPKSKFVQYFDNDYSQSGFFKYLNSRVMGSSNISDNKVEKLTAFQDRYSSFEKRILIFSAMCQVLVICTLVCGFFYMSSFLKRFSRGRYQHHMEKI